MMARLTVGKKKYAAVETRMWQIIDQAEALRAKLLETMQQDSSAFEAWMAANRLPKETEEQQSIRAAAVEQATKTAIEVPLQTAAQSLDTMKLAREVAEDGNLNAISDAGSAGELALTAITAAGYNVRINAPGLLDRDAADAYIRRAREIETQARETITSLRAILSTRGNFPLE
jgi:glutamate formiminotransferase/formiminotetrahydrofolate cyclodeaminase